MFLRRHKRVKDGKEHHYYSVMESRRLQSGKVAQRRVLYLGEINDSQQAAWRKTLEVFDEEKQQYLKLSLFADDRSEAADLDAVQVKLGQMQLRRARPYGNCWLGCELWNQLELDRFWERKLPRGREGVAWAKVLELLVVNRLIDPGSEFRVHHHWFDQSANGRSAGRGFPGGGEGPAVPLSGPAAWSIGRICSCICSSDGDSCSTRSSIWCCTT